MTITTNTPPPPLPEHPSPDDPVLILALKRALIVRDGVAILDPDDRADAWAVLLYHQRHRRHPAAEPQDAA